jgi:hypothetical protein
MSMSSSHRCHLHDGVAIGPVESLNRRQPHRQEVVMLARRPIYPVFAVIVVAILLVAGCTSTPEREGAAPPAPELQLIRTGPLDIPADCAVSGGAVYRTNFVVQSDGRVSEARTDPAPECLQRALVAWIEGAQYAPPGRAVPATVDWMLVSAPRLH